MRKLVYLFVIVFLLANLLSQIVFYSHHETPVNTMYVEYYRYYTITYYNDKLDKINVDLERYPAMYCDGYDDNNDEGQTCILTGSDVMNEFLEFVGQK